MNDLAPEYVTARRVLLDALVALEGHLDNLILVGAQAVYHYAGEGRQRSQCCDGSRQRHRVGCVAAVTGQRAGCVVAAGQRRGICSMDD